MKLLIQSLISTHLIRVVIFIFLYVYRRNAFPFRKIFVLCICFKKESQSLKLERWRIKKKKNLVRDYNTKRKKIFSNKNFSFVAIIMKRDVTLRKSKLLSSFDRTILFSCTLNFSYLKKYIFRSS